MQTLGTLRPAQRQKFLEWTNDGEREGDPRTCDACERPARIGLHDEACCARLAHEIRTCGGLREDCPICQQEGADAGVLA